MYTLFSLQMPRGHLEGCQLGKGDIWRKSQHFTRGTLVFLVPGGGHLEEGASGEGGRLEEEGI